MEKRKYLSWFSGRKSVALLGVLGCLSVGVVIYFSLFFYYGYQQELVEMEQAQLLTMARTVGKSLVKYIDQELESIELYFSDSDIREDINSGEMQEMIQVFVDKSCGLYDAMACYDAEGNLVFQEGFLDFDYGKVPEDETAVICGKKLCAEGWYQMFISRKFYRGKERYTIVCAMNLDEIYRQIVAPVQIGKGGYSIVKDSDLLILMHHAPSQIGIDAAYDRSVRYPQLDLKDLFAWITMQKNQEEGCSVINSYIWDDPVLSPEKRIVAYTTIHISHEKWIVNSTLPYDELQQPLGRMVWRLAGMSAIFFLFLVAFVYFMTRSLMRAEAQKKEIAYLKEINQGMELLRRKDEELQRYERMQSVGQMTSHIAHEFNNYLTPVMLYGEILESDESISAQNQQLLHSMIQSVEQAASLSRRLLDFSRQDSYGERIEQNLSAETSQACEMIRRMAPKNVSVITRLVKEELWILGNKGMMNHLLLNLCNNAFHAMEDRDGTLTIELVSREDEESDSSPKWAVLSVSDTGCGIKKEMLDKIFDPFFTTKRSGKGTGLGLSVVQKVMEAANGQVRIESKEGMGTTFFLSFPLIAPLAPDGENKEKKRFSKLIVVDDERDILDALRVMLKTASIKAEYYDHPAAVLSLLQKKNDYCDILLTDYDMPTINGLELASMIRRLNPQIHLVLMSGSDPAQFDWYRKNRVIDDFIAKTELSGKLEKLLQ